MLTGLFNDDFSGGFFNKWIILGITGIILVLVGVFILSTEQDELNKSVAQDKQDEMWVEIDNRIKYYINKQYETR